MTAKTSPDQQLLAISREMNESAQAGDWDHVGELEQIRLPLFQQIFAQGISGKEDLARQVLSLDEETKGLAVAEMPALREEILMMKKSGKANNAYHAVQDLAQVKP